MSNEVIRAIHERRSTRSFLDKPVSDEDLAAVLDAAIWAPSGSNSQSWLFTAITNKDVQAKINAIAKEAFQFRYVPDDDYPAKRGSKASAAREGYHFFNHAPVLIIASNKPGYENAMADCALAAENMFLAAQSLGLGSCYINPMHWLRDDEPLREYFAELGIPREHTICLSVALGYTDKETKAQPRKEGTIKIID